MKVDLQQQCLLYGFISNPTEVPSNPPNTIKKSDIRGILGSNDCPSVSKAKKFEEGDPKRVFGIQLVDREIEVLALSSESFFNWTDGLRVWLGGQPQEKENRDELKSLTDMFIAVRFLHLTGITLPDEPPPVRTHLYATIVRFFTHSVFLL